LLKEKLRQRIRNQSIEKWKGGIHNSNFLLKNGEKKVFYWQTAFALLIGGLMRISVPEFIPH
jgi:hypothetical protein